MGALTDASTAPLGRPNNSLPPDLSPDKPGPLLQLLTQWADEFLASDGTHTSTTDFAAHADDVAANAAAKTLFMQLLSELLPATPKDTPSPSAAQETPRLHNTGVPDQTSAVESAAESSVPGIAAIPGIGKGMLAASAVAYTAHEVASSMQRLVAAPGPALQPSWTSPLAGGCVAVAAVDWVRWVEGCHAQP